MKIPNTHTKKKGLATMSSNPSIAKKKERKKLNIM
jgi:hypothetical protein